MRFVLGDLAFPRHPDRFRKQRTARVPRVSDALGNARAPRQPRGFKSILQEHGGVKLFFSQLRDELFAAQPSSVVSAKVIRNDSVRKRLSEK